ncbi:MAG: metallophosphoesterase [Clostridia bacterium]|nr:metallophosphoesterase [Clostridia bacterium]
MKTKKSLVCLIISFLIISFTLVTVFENITFKVKNYTVIDKNLPKAFSGFKIVQISDLHNFCFDKDNKLLLKKVKEQKPDIIAITGDYIDDNKKYTDFASLVGFSKELLKIADCYFVSGNHEAVYGETKNYNTFVKLIKRAGITVLDNEMSEICKNGEKIDIIGLKDPLFTEIVDKKYTEIKIVYEDNLKKLKTDNYKILLSHRPSAFDIYNKYNANLVLSGHAHGGLINIPFVGGVFAPGEGFFPKYDKGEFKKDDTTMIVSGGLGGSKAYVRINNRPQLVVITLKR